MDDSFVVSSFKSLGDLSCNNQGLIDGETANALRERLTGNKLHDEVVAAIGFLQSVNGCDVWMIQRRQRLRLTLEARYALRIVGKRVRKEFQSNAPPKLCVVGLIDVAHPTRSQMFGDVVVRESPSDHGGRL